MSNSLRISEALKLGFSVIPTRPGAKSPDVSGWTQYQKKAMTILEAKKVFKGKKGGLGLICGDVSGGVECLDIDLKNDVSGTLYARLCEAIRQYDSGLFDSLVIVQTPSGGYHFWYKCPGKVGRNAKLAQRPATADELKEYNGNSAIAKKETNPHRLPSDLIETRANGGYALIPPSKGYILQQGDFYNIPTISYEQHEGIHNISKSLGTLKAPAVVRTSRKKVKQQKAQPTGGNVRPGDAFNDAHGIAEVMERYGWTLVNSRRMKKPNGKDPSHCLVDQKTNMAYLHTDRTPLPEKKYLTPFAVYTFYEHEGDFTAAGQQLFKEGFGRIENFGMDYLPKEQMHKAPKVKQVAKEGPKAVKASPRSDAPQRELPNTQTGGSDLKRFESGGGHFQCLGFDKGDSGTQNFYFFANGPKSVIRLTAAKMTRANLMTIAPLYYWREAWPKGKGIDVDEAANWLITICNQKGYYSGMNLRGRGAWMDAGRTVLHTGKKLMVDTLERDLADIESDYIYELGVGLDMSTSNPLSASESKKLVTLLERLRWDRDIDAYLLAGWLAIAPLCGALRWRPHIWITGAAGTGKSWVFKDIVRRMLGRVALPVQSMTTEAGLRQILRNDAIPVVFDEAEGEDKKAQERMQGVLGLMRSASADDGGVLAKGTQHGTAMTFKMRSCFAYASIVPQQMQQSDRRRITILELQGFKQTAETRKHFADTERMRSETLTPDYVRGFQARMIRLLPSILRSIEVFVSAVSVHLGSRALGDQLAPLLAGAWHCVSDLPVTAQAAKKFVQQQDWDSESNLENTTDEQSCLQFILSHQIRLETGGGAMRTLGEMVNAAVHGDAVLFAGTHIPRQHLQRIGLKIESNDTMLAISNSSPSLRGILKETPWAKNHGRVLKRIEGASASKGSIRFCTGLSTRAVMVPLDKII